MEFRFTHILMVLVALLLLGCKGDPSALEDPEEEEKGSTNPIDDPEVPDGVAYGGGYNPEDGYIYCTGKISGSGQVYMLRLYSNAASNKYYRTASNLPWGIYLPTEWNYPQEGIDLTTAYLRFAEYCQTNPNLAWYTNTSANVISSRTYTRH